MKQFIFSFFSVLVLFLLTATQVSAKPFFNEGLPPYADDLSDGPTNFAKLAKKVRHAVVNVSSENGHDEEEEEEDDESSQNPFFKRDPFVPRKSLGSGFIVSKDGYIITNNHVVQDGGSVVVRIPDDKSEYEAELIGRDPKTDIALIKLTEQVEGLEYLNLGDSDALEVGEWVLAIGNQFQLGQTVTAGIVSAKSRRVPSRSSGPYDQFIQTDASINPGSSGGPLLNAKGQVVGINTAIYSPGRERLGGTGFNIGIGFSIPINMAKEILIQLKRSGRVVRGLLGVIIQSVTPEVQEAMELPSVSGALVADVLEDTPAREAGFKVEDVIVEFDGQEVREHNDLPLMVARTPVGTVVNVVVLRNGVRTTLKPKIGELTEKKPVEEKKSEEPDRLGLVVLEVTDQFSEMLDQPKKMGVIVSKITPGSAAEKAGFIRGDVIEKIARRDVVNMGTYDEIVKALPKDRSVLVLVRRKEGTRFLTIKVK